MNIFKSLFLLTCCCCCILMTGYAHAGGGVGSSAAEKGVISDLLKENLTRSVRQSGAGASSDQRPMACHTGPGSFPFRCADGSISRNVASPGECKKFECKANNDVTSPEIVGNNQKPPACPQVMAPRCGKGQVLKIDDSNGCPKPYCAKVKLDDDAGSGKGGSGSAGGNSSDKKVDDANKSSSGSYVGRMLGSDR